MPLITLSVEGWILAKSYIYRSLNWIWLQNNYSSYHLPRLVFWVHFRFMEEFYQFLATCVCIWHLFFQASCSSGTKEVNEEQLKTGHSPKRYRVIGTLSNIREFSLAFHCPTGSQMNPKEKCEIFWDKNIFSMYSNPIKKRTSETVMTNTSLY